MRRGHDPFLLFEFSLKKRNHSPSASRKEDFLSARKRGGNGSHCGGKFCLLRKNPGEVRLVWNGLRVTD